MSGNRYLEEGASCSGSRKHQTTHGGAGHNVVEIAVQAGIHGDIQDHFGSAIRNRDLDPAFYDCVIGLRDPKRHIADVGAVNAIRGTDEASSPFSYAGPLTEIMLLGIVSMRANAKLHYDGANMRVTNHDEANEYLTRAYRPGFGL